MEIDPTNACNHDCIWCVDGTHRQLNKGYIEKDVAFRVIDQAAELGVRSIVLKGGGEPLVYPWIEELLYRIRDAGLPVGIITNGEYVSKHKRVILDTCSWLRISVDAGTSATHELTHVPSKDGAFERVWEGIRDVGPHLYCGIIFVIHPSTFHEMEIAARRAKENGCRYIAFKRVIADKEIFDAEAYHSIEANYMSARKHLEDETFRVIGFKIYNFSEGPKKQPYNECKAHHLIGILCANGQLYACCSTRGMADFSFGSVYESSLAEIWTSDRRRKILNRIDQKVCRHICPGHTSYMRYDHYNKMFEYLMLEDKPHGRFL
ncbi:MAG: radical SAM protein [Deltaproteobacteria bacterium]|nr:radical SAM protein [Deltaproteobacteria bacterium]